MIQLYCATQGASIGYTFEEGDDAQWQLYTKPLRFEAGSQTLRAKAIRIGYKESEENQQTISIA